MDKQKIIEGLKNGDDNVLVFLYKSIILDYRAYVQRNGGSEDDADIFAWEGIEKLRLHSQKKGFTIKGSPRAYLYVMCRNLWIDLNKKPYKKYETVFSKLDKEGNTQLDSMLNIKEDDDQQADAKMEAKRLEKIVVDILKQLPEKCKTILELRNFMGCKFDEISERLGIKVEAARKRAHGCRKKMRKAVLDSPHLDDLMDYFNFIKP